MFKKPLSEITALELQNILISYLSSDDPVPCSLKVPSRTQVSILKDVFYSCIECSNSYDGFIHSFNSQSFPYLPDDYPIFSRFRHYLKCYERRFFKSLT